jgi:hypothetical protein
MAVLERQPVVSLKISTAFRMKLMAILFMQKINKISFIH